jgi:hypothetical protein
MKDQVVGRVVKEERVTSLEKEVILCLQWPGRRIHVVRRSQWNRFFAKHVVTSSEVTSCSCLDSFIALEDGETALVERFVASHAMDEQSDPVL